MDDLLDRERTKDLSSTGVAVRQPAPQPAPKTPPITEPG
jgi:hypothetical protein